jgi:hypothetical protein|tara:strand:+ start:178 stop:603 length:426 start_codon:yes stop_codon:yes gene_type:complete
MKEHTLKHNSLIARMITFNTGNTDLTFYIDIPECNVWFPSGVLIHADITGEPYIQMYSDYVFDFLYLNKPEFEWVETPCFTPDLIDDRIILDAPYCTLNIDGCTKYSTDLKNPWDVCGGWEFMCDSCYEKIRKELGLGDSQ